MGYWIVIPDVDIRVYGAVALTCGSHQLVRKHKHSQKKNFERDKIAEYDSRTLHVSEVRILPRQSFRSETIMCGDHRISEAKEKRSNSSEEYHCVTC